MEETMYYRRSLTVEEFLFRVIEKSCIISIIALFLLTLILIKQGEKEIELLEKTIMKKEEQSIINENMSVKQSFFNYLDTLPLPEEEIVPTSSIKAEEQIAKKNSVANQNVTKQTSIAERNVNEAKKDSIANQNVAEENNIANEKVIQKTVTNSSLAEKVSGIIPTVKTFNTSAYCPCEECCGKTDAITSSGKKAKQWYTIAAGDKYKIGTIIYIPALKESPNEGWFIVEDRGGAISDDKLDIYMDSHISAKQFGRKNLECYIYEF